MDFETLRKKYPNFIYKDYKIEDLDDKIILLYNFEIENLCKFNPRIEFYKKNFKIKNFDMDVLNNIAFNIGMCEAISYFKATCSPNFYIKCGYLDEYQASWFKKLFYLGLGEFRYINQIDVSQDDLLHFISEGNKIEVTEKENNLSGFIIPVGGGKDSNVTLELLKDYRDDSFAFMIGSKTVSMECAKLAGFEDDKIIEIKRVIDNNLIDLNQKGFLNGHTPFSAIVAFITYFCSYILGKKYIVLSNEDSANESNVDGEKINHQYSKTIEFENDFREYCKNKLQAGPEYFSLLRPISEFQIAYLFSRYEKYHKIFKSCNVGSKKEPWYWCGKCPKCLFVYSILSPFLYKDKLVDIFGKDLFEDEELLDLLINLAGYSEVKPFECVGTYSEIRFALSETIRKLEKENKKLPKLLYEYNNRFELTNDNYYSYYNKTNNLIQEFDELLRKELFK